MLNFYAQKNAIDIKMSLDTIENTLHIQQHTRFYNTSTKKINSVFFHNWANSFKNNHTPLAKRFINDFKNKFHFSKQKDRGHTNIHNITVNNTPVKSKELTNQPDVLKITLPKILLPNESVLIATNYTVKLPNAKFTGYGKTRNGYHMRYWYLAPAVHQHNEWQIMSNLNIDDLFENITDFKIDFNVPKNYNVESNLYQYKTDKDSVTNFYLIGKNKKDIIININKSKRFKSFQTKNTEIKTDIFNHKIDYPTTQKIIQREVAFIEKLIGKHPHVALFIDANTVNKNSLKELYGLPDWLKPYPENFKWELRFFKALTTKYIDDILLLNKRTDHWLNDGIQTFLMIEYLKTYYADVKILGKYSKIWFFRNYNLAQLTQMDKYPFIYQLRARRFLDQPLTMRLDSLTKLNRKVVGKYKAGLGLKYLQDFLGDTILKKSIQEFYQKQQLKITDSKTFATILKSKTDKNLDWFFGDFIKTNKKIDYKITNVKRTNNNDSIEVTIKNKRDITTPVSLYGIHNKEVKFKTWLPHIDSVKTIKIKNNNFDRLAINYQQTYPEYNSLNNFRSVKKSLLNKPVQLRFFRDIENPYYHQIFYEPNVDYNLYDGISLGSNFNNKYIIKHNYQFSITPNYAFRSESLTGRLSTSYNQFLDKSKTLQRINFGFSGSFSHYDEDLSYTTFTPSINIQFRKKGLRDLKTKSLSAKLIHINRELSNDETQNEDDKYSVLKLSYRYNNPNIIQSLNYNINTEIASNFSKIYTDIRYTKFLSEKRRFNVRFFGGLFLSNTTNDNFFNFNINRGSDYLFELDLLGRSETTGIYSQEYIAHNGGFKAFFNQDSFANQFIATTNASYGIWKWLEIYNGVGVLKSNHKKARFFYENGIRLNFVPNFFEIYLPVYTNENFFINKQNYASNIRFVVTTDIRRIYNFFRRDFF